jgi:hypothetical protein
MKMFKPRALGHTEAIACLQYGLALHIHESLRGMDERSRTMLIKRSCARDYDAVHARGLFAVRESICGDRG